MVAELLFSLAAFTLPGLLAAIAFETLRRRRRQR